MRSRMPLRLTGLSVYHPEKIYFQPGMRTLLSSGFFQYECGLCYLWHLNSNMWWLVKTPVVVISGKGGVEEINLRQGNNNGLKHGFLFLCRQ